MFGKKYEVVVKIGLPPGTYERTLTVTSSDKGGAMAAAIMMLDAEGIVHVSVCRCTEVLPS